MATLTDAFRVVRGRVVAAAKHIVKPWVPSQRARYRLSQAYLQGEGIEIGALHNPLRTSRRARVRYVDRLPRSELLRHYPEMIGTGVVDPDIIDDGEKLLTLANGSLDFIIANNFIEHCENPIRTLQNFFLRLREGGIVYLAVPDKRYTFDRQRLSTPFEHLEQDHRDDGVATRHAHFADFARYSHFRDRASAADVQQLAQSWLEQNYSIHFHVWNFDEFSAFLKQLKASYLPGLQVAECLRNGNENIYILRKTGDQAGVAAAPS